MADKRVQYTLGFTADTAKAKAQLRDLQNQLDHLTSASGNIKNLPITEEVFKATAAAKELQASLQKAINVNTGKLDLSVLSDEFAKSGKSINDYAQEFYKLGPAGEAAFAKIGNAIVQSEAPLKRTNKLIQELQISLANTIKWQLSSSAIHAFMGAVQGAYGYAQDLNESLNNIRIVTGKSTEEMAKFAKQANTAAKALSTRTTDYTDAALIYYQQGLPEEEIQERAEVTVKMANVSRESAQIVSDQMTAVWNNFYNGSKSLEYYADVMTALGAATASSTDEIATGLEKFAAISNTVGLSYEYATSALATVTATTRQSADVVGTAFRTMFTRIQGLQQGETADDGVDLNKYSQALDNVGIQILDTNGQIKEMDTILSELGERWKTLGKEQQIALAQTVGGARQYTTLVALMDNWTFFQENLQTSYGATGELNKQQEIYAESWEAARDRVTAALEKIYQSILNDEFFIDLNNFLADSIELFDKLIDTVGGLPGVIGILGLSLSKLYNDKLPKFFNGIRENLQYTTGVRQGNAESFRNSFLSTLSDEALYNDSQKQLIESDVNSIYKERLSFLEKSNDLTGAQIIKYRQLIELEKEFGLKAIQVGAEEDKIKLNLDNYKKDLKNNVINRSVLNPDYTMAKTDAESQFELYQYNLSENIKKIKIAPEEITEDFINDVKEVLAKEEGIGEYLSDALFRDMSFEEDFDTAAIIFKDRYNKMRLEIIKSLSNVSSDGKTPFDIVSAGNITDEEINEYIQGMDKYNESQEKSMEVGEQFSKINEKIKDTIRGKTDAQKEDSDFLNENTTILKIFQEDLKRTDQGLVEAANGLGAFSIGWSSLSAAMSTLNNDSLSFFDKLPTLLSSGITGFISLGSAAKSFQTVNNLLLKDEGRGLAIQIASIFLKNEEIEALGNEITLKTVLSILQEKLNLQQIKSNLLSAQNLKNILNLAAGAGKLLLIIGALAVAWKGLTWLFNKWKESTPEGRLEKLTNETESARTAAQDAATAYNDLKTAIQDLESAENSIAKMTKGTLEWQYAIEEANAKALELINTYGLIQGKDWDFDKNGMIEIFKFGQEKMFEQQLEAKRNADALVDVSDKATREQEISNKIKVIENKLGANLSEDYLLDLYAKRNEIDTSVYGDSWSDIESLAKQIQQNNLLNVATVESKLRTNEELTGLLEPANLKTEETNAIYKWLAEDIANKDFSEEAKNVSQEQLESWAKTQRYEYKNNKFYKEDEEGKEVEVENLDLDKVKESIAYQDYLEDVLGDQDEIGKYVSKALQTDFSQVKIDYSMGDLNDKEINRVSNIKANFDKDDLEILENYKEHIQDVVESLENNEEMAERIAAANMNYNDGLQDLMDNFEDYEDMLAKGEGTEDYSKALEAIKEDIGKIIDIEPSELSEEFFTSAENLELMKQAANGSTDAVIQLQEAAAEDIIANVKLSDNAEATLISQFNQLKAFLDDNGWSNLELGTTLDQTGLTEGLNALIETSSASVADIQEMLNSIGFEPEIGFKEVPVEQFQKSIQTATAEIVDPLTGEVRTVTAENVHDYAVDGKIRIPTINGSKTIFRGSPKQITTSNPKSSGGSSKKDKKSSSKEIERYHVISNEIEEVQNELDKISTATERAFGADKLALIDAEIQKMRELKDAQDEYVRQIEENFEKDKQAIAAYGAVFNKNGTILNYEEIMQRQIDKFNASRTDAAEEEYQKFLDLLKQYEETNDLLDKERNESIKQAGELLDKELEDVEHRVNLQVEFNDDTIEYLEFLLEQLEDQAFSAAQSIDLLGRQVQENFDNIKSNSSGLAETLALAGFDSETIDGVLTGDQAAINKMMSQKGIDNNIIESVKEYRDALMGSMSNVRDLQKAIDEELINSLDEASEKFGELHDELNHNADILSSLQNIMDLTGESILGFTDDAKKALEDAQLDTAISQVATSYDELTMAQEEYKKAVESDQSEEVIKAAAEKVREAEEQLLSDWEAALEQATTNFEASIERSVAAFSNAVAGAYGGLDELQDAFDKQEELDDIYIEDYKKIYELTKLSRDISRSIDDSDNIKAKQALRDLQGEINELQKEGVELSEYDIEYLQKKYELRLAEIALEEAQNAKSTVRMTRDSEGNWSYTYTADQDDINEAQQNYEDKLYAIQELSDNYIKDMQSQVLDLLSAYEDEMAKINFSEEGWEQKAKEIEAFYQAKFNLLAQQFEGALGNQSDIYGEWEDYSALTGYGISANQDFIDSFDETTLSQLTGFQTMAEYQQVFTTNSQKLLTDLSGSFMDWRDHVQRVYEQAGKSTEDFAEKVGDMAEGVKEDNQSVVDSSESLKNEVIDNFEEAANGASAFADTWNEKIKTMTDSNNDLVESINDIIEAWARLNNAEEEKNRKQEQNEQEEKNDSSNNNNNNNNNKTLSENDSVSVKTSATHFATGQQMAGFVPGGSYSVMQVSGDRVLIGRNGVATGWVKKTDLVGFHSGGYTGEWGSSGKLAMLHEKELVLNANDTKNILTSVELMREISQAIDLNASMSAYSNAISAAMPNTGVITNQNIVINAEFPDATDRLEIQAAFDNLLNRASQYANRK